MVKKYCYNISVLILMWMFYLPSAPAQIDSAYDEKYTDELDLEAEGEEQEKVYEAFEPDRELRTIPDPVWERIKRDKRFVYKKRKQSKPGKRLKQKKYFNPFNSLFFKILLYGLVIVFLIIIVYLFLKNSEFSFRKNVKEESSGEDAPWEDLQRFKDWDDAFQQALQNKNYRLATRILYLQCLQILDQKDLINYQREKTNWYYVNKLLQTPLYDRFKILTTYFDYVWYGEYEVDDEQFEWVERQFKTFKSELAHA